MNRKGDCEYCGKHLGSRPYSGKFGSATEFIKLANFGDRDRAFAWNGAEWAAVTAVHHTERWWDLPATVGNWPCTQDHHLCARCRGHKADHPPADEPHKFVDGLCKACKFLRSEHDRRWKAKAVLGEHVHHLAAEWARGEEAQSDEVTDPYLDGLEEWYKAYEPRFVEVEQAVHYRHNRHEYVGTFDFLAEVNCGCPLADQGGRCLTLTDIKTGDFRADKDWLLQLAAYRYAESLTRWEEGKETVLRPMPTVNHTQVLWLRPDGPAQVVEARTTHETFNNFLRLIDLHNWARDVDKELAELTFEAEVDAQERALAEAEEDDEVEAQLEGEDAHAPV